MNEKVLKVTRRIIVPLLFVIGALVLPLYNLSTDTSPILTVISLVFAILVGFFIAAATTNYLNFQVHLAQENANIIALFNLCTLVNPTEKEKVADKLDQYLIATLDYPLTNYVEKTQSEFREVIESIDSLKPITNDPLAIAALDNLHAVKVELYKNRESISLAALRVTNSLHWVILILLSSVLIFLLFSLRTEGLLLDTVIGVLSATIYFILLLLYEIDSNVFLEEQLAYHDIQKVFKSIHKLPYYPSFAFKSNNVQKPTEIYRLGINKDYPQTKEKEITVCDKNTSLNVMIK